MSLIGRALKSNRTAQVSIVVLVIVAILVIFGGWLAPYDPLKQGSAILQGPSGAHWLGTDNLGRDTLSRLLAGSRLSVLGAVEATLVGAVLGAIPGLLSVYLGRTGEWLLLRLMDALLALPFIIVAIAVAGVAGGGLHPAMITIGVLFAPTFFRISRSATLGLRRAGYVEAAELFGSSTARLVVRHVWRKVATPIAVAAANTTGAGLLVVSSLMFLGIGVAPPAPTWGGMLATDLNFLSQAPMAPLAPAVLIMVTVGALNLLADAIREDTPTARSTTRRKERANVNAH
ncbi:peptide/nickel transport system permease protein [Antricoccus suffuscus]|uniref:Peptide/nickel transport system permease protein n=1 Tax=Antricoccus suffuscus TaxID=1629062 RepID=A0A2T1A390_9ACTN|nr:ABC transporter permease [Antricoccus suffuscus]PRZ43070.1 peptide/nickel transport system permease protein [Antricoccus suffuscus]